MILYSAIPQRSKKVLTIYQSLVGGHCLALGSDFFHIAAGIAEFKTLPMGASFLDS